MPALRPHCVDVLRSHLPGGRASGLLAVAFLILAGCLPARADAEASGPVYLQKLVTREVATRGDLVRVASRLLWRRGRASRGAEESSIPVREASAEEWARTMAERGYIARDESLDLDTPLRRGEACLLMSRILGLRGGLSGRLFGRGARTAYREMVDLGLLPGGGEHRRMSGAELLGLLDQVRQFQRTRGGGP